MTIARKKLVNCGVTRWYHCISRCVRQAFLLGDPNDQIDGVDRKTWVDQRLRFLSEIFAISVAGYAVLDNHLHALLRIDTDVAQEWSANEVARRWFMLFPPRNAKRQPIQLTHDWLESKSQDRNWVEERRQRLASISWFMKCLKEPLSRRINRIEGKSGTFFEGRFKSIGVLDENALLRVCAYIDLNPVAAGISPSPDQSPHTSVKERMDHVKRQARSEDLRAALRGSIAASRAASGLEEDLWLIPIEDRRTIDSTREGMVCGFSLGNYLMLVEYTGRLLRRGKASIPSEIEGLFDRLGTTAERWQEQIQNMLTAPRIGSLIASSRGRLREAASKLGIRRIADATS